MSEEEVMSVPEIEEPRTLMEMLYLEIGKAKMEWQLMDLFNKILKEARRLEDYADEMSR